MMARYGGIGKIICVFPLWRLTVARLAGRAWRRELARSCAHIGEAYAGGEVAAASAECERQQKALGNAVVSKAREMRNKSKASIDIEHRGEIIF